MSDLLFVARSNRPDGTDIHVHGVADLIGAGVGAVAEDVRVVAAVQPVADDDLVVERPSRCRPC